MSNTALNWAYQQTTGSAGRKAVLVALANLAGAQNSCYPSQAKLAAMTDQSERAVRGHLAELEESKLIRRTHRYVGGHRTSDVCYLHVAGVQDETVPADSTSAEDGLIQEDPAGSNEADSAGSNQAESAGTAELIPADSVVIPADSVVSTGRICRVTVNNPMNQRQELSTASIVDDFEERFWKIYPRRAGKQDARKAFERASKKFGVEAIAAGAERFASDPNLPEPQFIPHPATWLNQGRWADDPLPPRRDAGRKLTSAEKFDGGVALVRRLAEQRDNHQSQIGA